MQKNQQGGTLDINEIVFLFIKLKQITNLVASEISKSEIYFRLFLLSSSTD